MDEPEELDGKKLIEIVTPLLGVYGKRFTKDQWKHWAGVLGCLNAKDLTDSVEWWMNNRDEFPPSPAALKSHALDQVRKYRHHLHQLGECQRLQDAAPTEKERLPSGQVKAYCKYIISEIIEKKRRAPDRSNKARWYENEMEEYYDKEE